MSFYAHSGYLDRVFDKDLLVKHISLAKRKLKASGVQFDAIAVRGVSGLAFGAPLAYTMKKGLIVVRKTEENSHSEVDVEMPELMHKSQSGKYIFVDDFVSSGETMHKVVLSLYSRNSSLKIQAVYLYGTGERYDTKLYIRNLIGNNGITGICRGPEDERDWNWTIATRD